MLTKIYKTILYAFLIFILTINACSFLTTFNPKSLINPFHLKTRTISCYLLSKHIIFKSGIFLNKASKKEIISLINTYSNKYNVDPELIKIMVEVESEFNQFAISRTGAMGLMQIMPATFNDMKYTDPFDAEQNIAAGIKYFSIQKRTFKKLELALSAYNAGPSHVHKNQSVPDFTETKSYVSEIISKYSKLKTIGSD
ncbi:MAG TPA: lytic transglycosylase domain-containing protein [Flexistipes sinusarabici]|uniref:Lytic transglycosylase domain-containing protein n=2 Tax=Flexistipes sinusarabici TaxID=2352 RepID=A0A3D5QDF3_FLESI|nr:lytic transglycosylase domain-containing protein [Flexistipes sinusarabici]